MTKTVKRRLSLILAIILAFCWLPVSGSAQQLTETPEIVEPADVEIAGNEVVALRDETTKHYDMGNGVFQAVSYGHPVHELDENCQWQDIDFSLSLNQTRGVGVYSNEAAGISFPATYQRNQPVMSLSEGGRSVAMTLQPGRAAVARASAAKVTAEVSSPQRSFQTVEEANSAQFSNTVIYSGVLPGVDLEYIVDPGTVKENIIVKEKADSYRYAFTLELTGLTPVMQPDGGIILYAEGTDEECYVIPTPYMYDALGCFSEAVTYTLSGNASPYTLTVTADAEWINEADRGFPVTIDPSVVKTTGITYDTFIDSGFPDSTRATATELWVRENRIPFIKTQTPDIPTNATLNWATLSAFYFYNDNISSGMVKVSAHQVVYGNWNPSTLTWNGVSHLYNYGISTGVLDTVETCAGGATANNPCQVDFYITGAVQSWLDGSSENYGIALRYCSDSTNLSVVFKSYEAGYDTRPRITYCYTETPDYYYRFYHDSTMTQAQIEQATNALGVVNTSFDDQFGLLFGLVGPSVLRSDFADACPEGPDVKCGDSCDYDEHHKDVWYTSNKLLNEIPQNSNEIVVLWTNHPQGTHCNHTKVGCYTEDAYALVIENRPVIHMLKLGPNEYSSEAKRAMIGVLLLHETAHAIGMGENYNDEMHQDSGYQCVMEPIQYTSGASDETNIAGMNQLISFYNGVESGTTPAFCKNCANEIREMLGLPLEP